MRQPNPTHFAVLAWLALATPALGTEEALLLRVTPQVAHAPATVSIIVTVERATENRELMVEDDSEDYYRSSVVPLEGDKAARTHLLFFHGLPAGQHRISATVRGASGLPAAVSTRVSVIGNEASEGIVR